jgi:hypothetical protein
MSPIHTAIDTIDRMHRNNIIKLHYLPQNNKPISKRRQAFARLLKKGKYISSGEGSEIPRWELIYHLDMPESDMPESREPVA